MNMPWIWHLRGLAIATEFAFNPPTELVVGIEEADLAVGADSVFEGF